MKKISVMFLSFILLIAICFNFIGCESNLSQKSDEQLLKEYKFDYIESDNSYTITRYLGTDSEVIIPSKFNGIPIKIISHGAFNHCEHQVTKITIPKSILSLGDTSFKNTEIYKNEANWEDGILYIDDFMVAAKGITGKFKPKDGT